LFFVDHSNPHAGRDARADSFMERLVLEREFVQTDRVKTTPIGWLLLGCRLRQPSQSIQQISPGKINSRAEPAEPNCKAQTPS